MNRYNEEWGGGGIWTKAVVVVVNSIQNLYIEFVRNEKIIVLAKLKVSLKITEYCRQEIGSGKRGGGVKAGYEHGGGGGR